MTVSSAGRRGGGPSRKAMPPAVTATPLAAEAWLTVLPAVAVGSTLGPASS